MDVDDELAYVDTLPEEVKLVEVNSNIWGTKFKIHGIAKNLPANLGQISYKTSLLHLQPRQMTVVVTELRDDLRHEPDPNFNPHIFSEDEDETTAASRTASTAATNNNASSPSAQSALATTAIVELRPSASHNGDDANTGLLPVASMMLSTPPRPNRLLPRCGAGKSGAGTIVLGPLAKAESYEDDSITSDSLVIETAPPTAPKSTAASNGIVSRPPGPSYSSLVTQYSRSSSNSSGQSSSRHAISPLCSDGSVPTLQSPKNAVAPSDIIFDRPPPSGVHSLSNSGSDCAMNVVKSSAVLHATASGTATTTVPGVRRRGDMQYIDEESAGASTSSAAAAAVVEPIMHRTPTIVSISPAVIVRSCSVGYLDTVEIIPSDVTLSILRKEAPNKRLVLVDRKPNASGFGSGKTKATARRPHKKKLLVECGKSKSLDSCDLLQVLVQPVETMEAGNHHLTPAPPMPRVHETSETEDSSSDIDTGHASGAQTGSDRDFLLYTPGSPGKSASVKTQAPPTAPRSHHFCIKCKIMSRECQCKSSGSSRGSKQSGSGDSGADLKLAVRAKKEAVTSFADSPLFTRKHRFGESSTAAAGGTSTASSARSPNLGKKNEFSFSFLKQLSEARRRKRDEMAGATREEREVQEQIDVDTGGAKDERGFASLHSQALSTLENIISRLKDLEDNR